MPIEADQKISADEAISYMMKLARDPAKKAEMQAAWDKVLDRLEPFYLVMKPKPKSFEVHHMNETARFRFACAMFEGRPLQDCIELAVARITGH